MAPIANANNMFNFNHVVETETLAVAAVEEDVVAVDVTSEAADEIVDDEGLSDVVVRSSPAPK